MSVKVEQDESLHSRLTVEYAKESSLIELRCGCTAAKKRSVRVSIADLKQALT